MFFFCIHKQFVRKSGFFKKILKNPIFFLIFWKNCSNFVADFES